MAFLQQFAIHNSTAEDQLLFEAAVEIAGSKVVIKRAPGAEHLAFQTPASSIEGNLPALIFIPYKTVILTKSIIVYDG